MIEYGAVVKIKEKMDWEKAASLFVRSGFALNCQTPTFPALKVIDGVKEEKT